MNHFFRHWSFESLPGVGQRWVRAAWTVPVSVFRDLHQFLLVQNFRNIFLQRPRFELQKDAEWYVLSWFGMCTLQLQIYIYLPMSYLPLPTYQIHSVFCISHIPWSWVDSAKQRVFWGELWVQSKEGRGFPRLFGNGKFTFHLFTWNGKDVTFCNGKDVTFNSAHFVWNFCFFFVWLEVDSSLQRLRSHHPRKGGPHQLSKGACWNIPKSLL